MSSLNVNDILDELFDENRRILNELLFANKYITKSLEFKKFIDSIAEEFVDHLNPDVKKKFEELSLGLNQLMDQKLANISDDSPNESEASDHQFQPDSDIANEDNVSDEEEYIIKYETVEELDVNESSEANNDRQKYICDRCGNTYDLPEVLDFHVQYCRLNHIIASSDTGITDNRSPTEEQVIDSLISRDVVSGDLDNSVNIIEYDSDDTIINESTDDLPIGDRAEQKTRSSNRNIFPYKCPFVGCNAINSNYRAVLAHKKKFHQLKCDFRGCDYQTNQNNLMKMHMFKHSNARQFQCNYCDKNYKYNSALRYHVKNKHSDQCPEDQILVCDWNECQYTTKLLRSLNAHKCSHTLPFECHNCQQKFPTMRLLVIHLNKYHD